jgi:hypothetical protein
VARNRLVANETQFAINLRVFWQQQMVLQQQFANYRRLRDENNRFMADKNHKQVAMFDRLR